MKKIFSIFLLFVICFASFFSLVGCCEHEWTEVSNTATCYQEGEITYKCSLCEKTKTEKSSPTEDHNYVEGDTVDPTKYNKGYTIYTCSVCGKTEHRNETSSLMDQAEWGMTLVLNRLKSKLKDPSSILYTISCYSRKDSVTGEEIAGCFVYAVNYNAKNGFGAYVGYKYVYYNSNGGTISSDYYYKYKCDLYFYRSN